MDDAALIDRARQLVRPMRLARTGMDAATVGCVLVAENGMAYDGVCIHLACGLGFCAEAAAMANMVKDGQTRIMAIVAVTSSAILSPCGRCREMMVQIDDRNFAADVILDASTRVKIKELLPMHWLRSSVS